MTDYVPSQRLTTWKEIGEYIGRDSRTARRYEFERQLPVHRMPNGEKSTVYALRHELDRWLAGDEALASDLVTDSKPASSSSPESSLPAPSLAKPEQPHVPAPPSHAPTVRDARRPHLWLQRFIAPAVGLGVLGVFALGAAGMAFRPPSASTASADLSVERLCTSGRYAWERRTPQDLRRAVDDFTQAIVLDPNYAPAYVGLADSYNLMPMFGAMSPAEAYPRAKTAAERAVALSPASAAAHRALAFVTFWWARDQSSAMREFKTAIRLDPNSALTYHWYANVLSEAGEPSEALAAIRKALELDPASTPIRASEGSILRSQGRLAEARRVLEEVEAVQPDYLPPYEYLAEVLEAEGDDVGYLQQEEQAALLMKDPDAARIAEAARRALARGGHMAMLQELARREEGLTGVGKQSPYQLALTELRRGERRQAISALEQLVSLRDPNAIGLAENSEFSSLHGEPAFERLLLRIGPSR